MRLLVCLFDCKYVGMCWNPSSFPSLYAHPWLGISPLLPGVCIFVREHSWLAWIADHVWWSCGAAAPSPLSPFLPNFCLGIYPHIDSSNFLAILAVKKIWRIFRCVCYSTPTWCCLYGFLGCLCKAMVVVRHCFYK